MYSSSQKKSSCLLSTIEYYNFNITADTLLN